MTKKIYLDDSYRTAFSARVVKTHGCASGCEVVLDQTCFYPGGGGQPCDLGTLGGEDVLEVTERGGEIVHVVAREPVEQDIQGVVDWSRRHDHMQQHTGQHLLTRCFDETAGADTVGFSLGEEATSIELDCPSVSTDQLRAAQAMANRIVSEHRPVTAKWIERDRLEADGVRARGLAEDIRLVRVIEIEGVDRTSCGGTHVQNTAEIGPVRITSTERIRGRPRVYFLCGGRAHGNDLRKAEILDEICSELSTGMADLPRVVRGKVAEIKELRRNLDAARLETARHLARSLLAEAEQQGAVRVVAHVVENWGMPELTDLAKEIASAGKAVALIGSAGEKPAMVFAASPDSGLDAGKLMADAAKAFGGRGGGTAELSRGGCPDTENLARIIDRAREHAVSRR